jgi:hypothetical protein
MSITFEENVRLLEEYREKARGGAQAVANAMARYVAERVANDTLTRRRLAPGTYHKAKPGDPPSYGSGNLARSMFWNPASEGLRATAIVGSTDKRAKLFEFGGCDLTPTNRPRLHWRDSRGWWSHPALKVSVEHPFLGPTTEDAINEGELQRVAIEAAIPFDP